MFIWTIRDVIELIGFGLIAMWIGAIFLSIKIQDRKLRRKKVMGNG